MLSTLFSPSELTSPRLQVVKQRAPPEKHTTLTFDDMKAFCLQREVMLHFAEDERRLRPIGASGRARPGMCCCLFGDHIPPQNHCARHREAK